MSRGASGISPRGSYVNLLLPEAGAGAGPSGPPSPSALGPGTPLTGAFAFGAEKERARAAAALAGAAEQLERAKKEAPAMPAAGSPALPIAAYCVASILMTVVNKFVVSGRQFDMTFLLLAVQSMVCVACVWVVKQAGVISFREFSTADAKAWFPVSALLVAVIYTGSKSLQFLSIPVYTIFKNLTIILIAYGEVVWFGGSVTGLTLASFGLMVGSSVVAAWADIVAALDPAAPAGAGANAGYLWMATNCLVSAAYVLFMRRRIKATGFKDWDSMFYNNLLSVPVLVACSLLVEDWSASSLARNFPQPGRNVLFAAIAFSGAAAVLISYSTAWCVRVCGSTTYSMVGALNKLPVAASGILFFGDPANFGNVTAIALGGVAGIVYAVAKTSQAKADRARQARLAEKV